MEYKKLVEIVAQSAEVAGIGVILAGIMIATVMFFVRWRRNRAIIDDYRTYRQNIGRSILLGLEFLVAGDIIRSIAVPPSFESIGFLIAIILIRSFLAVELEMEIEGRWPWQRSQGSQAKKA